VLVDLHPALVPVESEPRVIQIPVFRDIMAQALMAPTPPSAYVRRW
jgi:hypothetical protein